MKTETDTTGTHYKHRGYGCEGVYVGLQSALLNVQVISLIRGSLDAGTDSLVFIHTGRPTDPAVFIHTGLDSASAERLKLSARTVVIGQPRQANLNWALDGFAHAGAPMTWGLDSVVHKLELEADDLGITGQSSRLEGLGAPVFVPVAVTRAGGRVATNSPAPVELVVRIPAASEVDWKLADGGQWKPGNSVAAADGYFRIVIEDGRTGELQTVLLRWRARGTPTMAQAEPERLTIYRW